MEVWNPGSVPVRSCARLLQRMGHTSRLERQRMGREHRLGKWLAEDAVDLAGADEFRRCHAARASTVLSKTPPAGREALRRARGRCGKWRKKARAAMQVKSRGHTAQTATGERRRRAGDLGACGAKGQAAKLQASSGRWSRNGSRQSYDLHRTFNIRRPRKCKLRASMRA